MNKENLIVLLTIILIPVWVPMFLIRFCWDRTTITMRILGENNE